MSLPPAIAPDLSCPPTKGGSTPIGADLPATPPHFSAQSTLTSSSSVMARPSPVLAARGGDSSSASSPQDPWKKLERYVEAHPRLSCLRPLFLVENRTLDRLQTLVSEIWKDRAASVEFALFANELDGADSLPSPLFQLLIEATRIERGQEALSTYQVQFWQQMFPQWTAVTIGTIFSTFNTVAHRAFSPLLSIGLEVLEEKEKLDALLAEFNSAKHLVTLEFGTEKRWGAFLSHLPEAQVVPTLIQVVKNPVVATDLRPFVAKASTLRSLPPEQWEPLQQLLQGKASTL